MAAMAAKVREAAAAALQAARQAAGQAALARPRRRRALPSDTPVAGAALLLLQAEAAQ
jgi:hypothetical protein